MTKKSAHPVHDHPWRGRGAVACGREQVRLMVHPPVTVSEPGSMVIERNVAVVMRDGTTLRVNVYRPAAAGPCPVLLSAHPYGKDKLPRLRRRGATVAFQFHAMRQTAPLTISTLTSWEAPDPAVWVARGYAVVNADLRGAGASDGVGALLSDLEASDIYDMVEWAGTQPWSTGKVGLFGVSYLALSQYKPAALHPPHLAAICPWEGFSDMYRDFALRGGVAERGFFRIWALGTRRTMRSSSDLYAGQRDHPLHDEYWDALVPDLAAITVPMLVCASFSDNNLHSLGSFRAFIEAGSSDRFAYTHRGGKWATFYGAEAVAAQQEFFDTYLKGGTTDPATNTDPASTTDPATSTGGTGTHPAPSRRSASLPRVRLEVREDRRTIAVVRSESTWPLVDTDWTPLYLAGDGLLLEGPRATEMRSGLRDGPIDKATGPQTMAAATAATAALPRPGSVRFATRRNAVAFTHTFARDTELTGPIVANLWVSVEGIDADLFVGVEKWRDGRYIGFEGSYGFPRDRVATGWLRVSLRELDEHASRPWRPVPALTTRARLAPGEIAPVSIPLGPSSTQFRAGESIRLVVAGRWLWPSNPLTGQFPARYPGTPRTRVTVHWSAERPAHLLVPVIPAVAR